MNSFISEFDENGNEKRFPLHDWEYFRTFTARGKRWINQYIKIEEIPTWGQYKYLIGYLGDLLIEAGEELSHDSWVFHIEKYWNYEMIKVKDHDTGEIVEERRPRSINMRSASKKRLVELTELAHKLLDKLHIDYLPLQVWEDQNCFSYKENAGRSGVTSKTKENFGMTGDRLDDENRQLIYQPVKFCWIK